MSDEDNQPKERTSRRTKDTQKRELEKAPLMLRKASIILLIGALFPFFSALKYAATAAYPVDDDMTFAFTWIEWAIAKAGALLGGWILYECTQVRDGDKPKSVLKGLANAHPMAGFGVAAVIWIAVLVYIFSLPPLYVAISVDAVKPVFSLGAAAEVMTIMLAMFSLAHIYHYEHGGKFNPMIPLLMIGPGLAGLLNLIASFTAFSNPHAGLGALGLIGSVIVAAGGGLAIYTMYASFQEAKVQGEAKKAAMREARKAERAAKRQGGQ